MPKYYGHCKGRVGRHPCPLSSFLNTFSFLLLIPLFYESRLYLSFLSSLLLVFFIRSGWVIINISNACTEVSHVGGCQSGVSTIYRSMIYQCLVILACCSMLNPKHWHAAGAMLVPQTDQTLNYIVHTGWLFNPCIVFLFLYMQNMDWSDGWLLNFCSFLRHDQDLNYSPNP